MELPVIQSGKKISIIARETKLIFNEAPKNENPFYHFAFNIPSNKFGEAFLWINKKKSFYSFRIIIVIWQTLLTVMRSLFFFKDPCGNILEMIARFDLKDNVNKSFSERQIRNISEIGIVFPVKTFDKDVSNLMEEYFPNYFDKQPPLPYFRAIGNDEELLIVVPEDRVWFATDNRSKIGPAEITFIDKNKFSKIIFP